jgi:RimJ/RimL family protein N-acetyltransferase
MIKQASLSDIPAIKKVADKHTKEIGFIMRPAFEASCNQGELIFDEESISFCRFHKRRDYITTIYEVCVPREFRGKGLGLNLLKETVKLVQGTIRLKCPVDNESNKFYKKIGMELVGVDPGKLRELNIWTKTWENRWDQEV